MKVAILVVVLAALVAVYFFVSSSSNTAPAPTGEDTKLAYWEQSPPPGAKIIEGRTAKFDVVCERRNNKSQAVLEFHITEEHGWRVDQIVVDFWYRSKDPQTGEWIDDSKKVSYTCRKSLEFNDTLVDNTVLLDVEFDHLGIDLLDTTTENWKAEVAEYQRAMEPGA